MLYEVITIRGYALGLVGALGQPCLHLSPAFGRQAVVRPSLQFTFVDRQPYLFAHFTTCNFVNRITSYNVCYTKLLRYTTIRKADQEAAVQAVRAGVMQYDHRLGYRGPEAFMNLPDKAGDAEYEEALAEHDDDDDLRVALVLAASRREVKAVLKSGEEVSVTGDGLRFAATSLQRGAAQRRIRRGAIIRVRQQSYNFV